MATSAPETTFDRRFSSDGAQATPWTTGRAALEHAEIFWLSTVRPDGRPHVTPLIAVWHDGALHFATGPEEQKAKNLAQNPHCALITGCNALNAGLDLIVAGDAVLVTDEARLHRLAELYDTKYGWHNEVQDGAFSGEAGRGLVYAVAPATAFAFGRETAFGRGRSGSFSQTRWRF